MVENGESVPLLFMMSILLVMARSLKFEVLSVILVGSLMSCVILSDSIASFNLISKLLIPLCFVYWLSRKILPVFRSPSMSKAVGEYLCASVMLSASLSVKSVSLSEVRFGGR